MKTKTIAIPKPDMMAEIKDEVFNDLDNLMDDVMNCFDVDEDVTKDKIQSMVKEAIEKGIKEVVATMTGATPNAAKLVKDKAYIEEVLSELTYLDKREISDDSKDYIKEIAGMCGGMVCINTDNLATQLQVEAFLVSMFPNQNDYQQNVLFA